MFNVVHIDHVVLRVRDMATSIAFYETVLGLTIARDRPELGLVHLRAGASLIDLISVDGPLGRAGGAAAGGGARNVDHLCLRIDPFDEPALRTHLLAHGLTPPEPAARRYGAEGEGLSIYIQDPDGNTIELRGPPL